MRHEVSGSKTQPAVADVARPDIGVSEGRRGNKLHRMPTRRERSARIGRGSNTKGAITGSCAWASNLA